LIALDIGLSLLGGDPMGFYEQPEEVQLDLLAYHQICAARSDAARFGLLRPLSLDDAVTMELVKRGKVHIGQASGVKVGKDQYQHPGPTVMPTNLVMARMKAKGVDPSAVSWLFEHDKE